MLVLYFFLLSSLSFASNLNISEVPAHEVNRETGKKVKKP